MYTISATLPKFSDVYFSSFVHGTGVNLRRSLIYTQFNLPVLQGRAVSSFAGMSWVLSFTQFNLPVLQGRAVSSFAGMCWVLSFTAIIFFDSKSKFRLIYNGEKHSQINDINTYFYLRQ